MAKRKTHSTLPSSVLIDLPEPLAVVCHDAGATNLIVSWLKHYSGAVQCCRRGPAAVLWGRAFPGSRRFSLENALKGAAVLLTGTSWASDIEHRARKLARTSGMRSIAVVDHWVNYRERFVRGEELVQPTELWVADDEARMEARRCFPRLPIRQLPNLYLEELAQEIAACHPQPARQCPQNILYVLEPIRTHWGHDDRPGELQAFEFFMNNLSRIGVADGVQIRLRPHPSDASGKYVGWLGHFPRVNIEIDTAGSLAEQIAWADWVVGCESFALVVALHAKRIVISTLPPWASRCRLPHRGLLHLRDMLPSPT